MGVNSESNHMITRSKPPARTNVRCNCMTMSRGSRVGADRAGSCFVRSLTDKTLLPADFIELGL
jgi:hypothetical protein